MSRKWIGAALSVALAALGTFVILGYVNSAEERALEGQETVEVLVVRDTVPKGSAAEGLATRVDTVLLPAKVQAPGSVADLSELQGKVAAVDLVPGEQVLASRFVTEEELAALDEFELPDGLLEVTLSLEPERALGGELVPGDLVSFVASFNPFELDGVEPSEDVIDPTDTTEGDSAPKTPNSTHIVINNLVVTHVQLEKLPAENAQSSADAAGVELAPTGNLLVTLGAEAADVEKIVFTAEFGLVWLAHESDNPVLEGTQIQTRNTIYR